MKKILFLIGSANISGGTYVIFQHALHLQSIGLNITLACIEFEEFISLKKSNDFWHPGLKQLDFISINDVNKKEYDLAIFTWWKTIFYLPNLHTKKIVYFIQSIESKFYDPLDTPLCNLVNSTYTFNIPVITEATWIKHYLYTHYGSHAQLVHNGIRKDIYCLSIEKTTEVYRSCDILVKLSYVEGMFAPPLEIFHCGGTCIVYDVTGHDEYIKNNYNGIVVKTDDEESVIAAIQLLINDQKFLNKLKAGALETAKLWLS